MPFNYAGLRFCKVLSVVENKLDVELLDNQYQPLQPSLKIQKVRLALALAGVQAVPGPGDICLLAFANWQADGAIIVAVFAQNNEFKAKPKQLLVGNGTHSAVKAEPLQEQLGMLADCISLLAEGLSTAVNSGGAVQVQLSQKVGEQPIQSLAQLTTKTAQIKRNLKNIASKTLKHD